VHDKTFKVQYAKAGSWEVVNVPVPPVGVRDYGSRSTKSASAALTSTCIAAPTWASTPSSRGTR
jgi:hypothetical protein